MVGLLDIAPLVKTVTVQGVAVEVHGVSAKGIAHLISRFPEIKTAFANRKIEGMTAERLIELVPDAIAAIIAAGCGCPGDAGAETTAANLPVGDQLELLAAISELTMPQGAGPFAERLMALMNSVGGASGKGQDTKSEPPANG